VIELGTKLGHTIGITPNPTKIEFMPSLSSSIDLLSNTANLSGSFHNVIRFDLPKMAGPEGLEPSTSGSADFKTFTAKVLSKLHAQSSDLANPSLSSYRIDDPEKTVKEFEGFCHVDLRLAPRTVYGHIKRITKYLNYLESKYGDCTIDKEKIEHEVLIKLLQ